MLTEVLWWIFAVAIVIAAAGVVFARSVIHAAIALILTLAGVGAMYLFLQVEFLALVQFLIYGGAVTVLILLALMVTRAAAGTPRGVSLTGPQAPWALLVGGGLAAILVGSAVATAWPGDVDDEPTLLGIETISERLFTDFGAAFVIATLLLLVALAGAIIIARQERGE